MSKSNISKQYLGRILNSNVFIFICYIILVYIFFAIDVDIANKAIAPGDGSIFGLPTKIFSAKLSAWNPYVMAGTYSFKDIQNQSFYLPGLIIMNLFPNALGYNLLLLLHYASAGFFTYLFLRKLNMAKIAAFIGGMCFMFSGFLVSHKGHHAMMQSAIWLPLILYFIESYYIENKIKHIIFSSVSFSFCILADYTAVAMYTGMVVLPYIIFKTFSSNNLARKEIKYKTAHILRNSFLIFFGGLLLSSVAIIPIIESLKFSIRENISYEFFSSYSFPLIALPSLLFPYIFGTHTPNSIYQQIYFGPWNLTEMTGYIGILPLLFAALAFLIWRKKNRSIWFWSLVAMLAFILVLGSSTPIYKIMYYVPIYNMFRVSARNWFEVNFAISVLSAYFVNYLLTDDSITKSIFHKFYTRVCLYLSIALIHVFAFIFIARKSIPILINLSGDEFLNKHFIFYSNPQTVGNLITSFLASTSFLNPSIFIPVLIIISSLITLYFSYKYKRKFFMWIITIILLFADMFSFGHYHDNTVVNPKNFVHDEIIDYLKENETDTKRIRVLPLELDENELYPFINVLYGINTINYYGPNWLKEYKEFTSFDSNGLALNTYDLVNRSSVLSLLSTKYIITRDESKRNLLNSVTRKTMSDYKSETIFSSFNSSGWEFIPQDMQQETVSLKSTNGKDVSIIQYKFSIEENTNYQIEFDARAIEFLNHPLYVDFFTDQSYDREELQSSYDYSVLSSEFQTYRTVFNTGENCPAFTNLRFFTFSTKPIEVKNVVLRKIESNGVYWGKKENNQDEYPLYVERHITNSGISIYENMNFLPRARFVTNITSVGSFSTANDIINNDFQFNPSTTALVEDYDGQNILDYGEVLEEDYSKNDEILFTVKTGDNSFLVLSDTWYTGWKAYVDGKETKIYKTNGIMRGILINREGEHRVEFVFRPESFYIGLAISFITLVTMVSILILENKRMQQKNHI